MSQSENVRTVVWQTLDAPGAEHIRFAIKHGDIWTDGVMIGVVDETPFRIQYTIQCDERYISPFVRLEVWNGSASTLSGLDFSGHGAGIWKYPTHKYQYRKQGEIRHLRGCTDVDLMGSAFTNTLPIRRLTWEVGVPQEIKVVYIAVPTLELSPMRQRYTLLAEHDGGERTFRYESLSDAGETTYQADLRVDADGLVITYEGLFRRVYPPVE